MRKKENVEKEIKECRGSCQSRFFFKCRYFSLKTYMNYSFKLLGMHLVTFHSALVRMDKPDEKRWFKSDINSWVIHNQNVISLEIVYCNHNYIFKVPLEF